MDETRTGTTETVDITVKVTVTKQFSDVLEKAAMLAGMSLQGFTAVAFIERLERMDLLYKWAVVMPEGAEDQVDYIGCGADCADCEAH